MFRKISICSTDGTFGFGIDVSRNYLNCYSWWEHELHITIGNRVVEIYFNAKGLPK